MTSETPRSRRERPAKPALTRAGIVSASIGVLRDEGLAKVTMRRIAQELDTGPASLYVYVRNTAELHAAILDELLGTIETAPAGGSWRARIEQVLGSYTRMLLEYPSLARSAVSARPSGVNYLNLCERLLALLDAGGVPPAQAAWGVDVLLQLATATAAEHATQHENSDSAEEWDALTRALRGASADTHPRIAALGPQLVSGTPEQRLSWGFRSVLTGITHTPVPEGEPE